MITRGADEGEFFLQCTIPFEVEQVMGIVDGDVARLDPTGDDRDIDRASDGYDVYVRAIQDGLAITGIRQADQERQEAEEDTKHHQFQELESEGQ